MSSVLSAFWATYIAPELGLAPVLSATPGVEVFHAWMGMTLALVPIFWAAGYLASEAAPTLHDVRSNVPQGCLLATIFLAGPFTTGAFCHALATLTPALLIALEALDGVRPSPLALGATCALVVGAASAVAQDGVEIPADVATLVPGVLRPLAVAMYLRTSGTATGGFSALSAQCLVAFHALGSLALGCLIATYFGALPTELFSAAAQVQVDALAIASAAVALGADLGVLHAVNTKLRAAAAELYLAAPALLCAAPAAPAAMQLVLVGGVAGILVDCVVVDDEAKLQRELDALWPVDKDGFRRMGTPQSAKKAKARTASPKASPKKSPKKSPMKASPRAKSPQPSAKKSPKRATTPRRK